MRTKILDALMIRQGYRTHPLGYICDDHSIVWDDVKNSWFCNGEHFDSVWKAAGSQRPRMYREEALNNVGFRSLSMVATSQADHRMYWVADIDGVTVKMIEMTNGDYVVEGVPVTNDAADLAVYVWVMVREAEHKASELLWQMAGQREDELVRLMGTVKPVTAEIVCAEACGGDTYVEQAMFYALTDVTLLSHSLR